MNRQDARNAKRFILKSWHLGGEIILSAMPFQAVNHSGQIA
jgi:hypothetical protein